MAFSDALKDKIIKLGNKQKLGAVLKYSSHRNNYQGCFTRMI